MKKLIFSLLFLSSLSVFGQETWNVCSQTVNVIPQPSYDSTFVLSAPSRAALAKGMASWTASFGQSDINKLVLFDDFIATPTTTGNIFQTTASGGTAGSIDIPTAGIQGLLRLSTSTWASGRVHVGTYTNALTAGAGEWKVQIRLDTINVLCDNTERYAILIGFFDTYTGVNQFDGMYFLYDSIGTTSGSASSDKWQTVTINNGATTSFITTSKLVSTSGGTFGINVNADGTSVDYVIDGDVVRTETTGVVSGAGRTFGLGVMIIKSAGTTARFCYVDYINAEYTYQKYGR